MANSIKIKVNGLTHGVTASLDTPFSTFCTTSSTCMARGSVAVLRSVARARCCWTVRRSARVSRLWRQ